MKRLLLSLTAALLSLPFSPVSADAVTGAELHALKQRIAAASAETRTLQARFVQTKTLSLLSEDFRSEGRLFYAQPQQVRWQYTAPYQYDFVLRGTQVTIRSEKSAQQLDAAGNKMFRQLCTLIAGCVDGSLLTSGSGFSMVWTRSDGLVGVQLTPQDKPFKDLMSRIDIFLRETDCMVSRIRMEEPGGDTTLIEFSECILNQPIDDATFHIQ